MDENRLALAGILVFVVFVFSRRLKRLFSRQRYSTLRVLIPVGLFGLLTFLLFPMLSLTTGLAPTVGVAVGVALGLYGFRLTKFDSSGDEIYFTPDRYVGSIVLVLFVGRMTYRVLALGNLSDLAASQSNGAMAPIEFVRSPLTAALLFVLLGYYLSYYVSIWTHGRTLRASTLASN